MKFTDYIAKYMKADESAVRAINRRLRGNMMFIST